MTTVPPPPRRGRRSRRRRRTSGEGRGRGRLRQRHCRTRPHPAAPPRPLKTHGLCDASSRARRNAATCPRHSPRVVCCDRLLHTPPGQGSPNTGGGRPISSAVSTAGPCGRCTANSGASSSTWGHVGQDRGPGGGGGGRRGGAPPDRRAAGEAEGDSSPTGVSSAPPPTLAPSLGVEEDGHAGASAAEDGDGGAERVGAEPSGVGDGGGCGARASNPTGAEHQWTSNALHLSALASVFISTLSTLTLSRCP